MAAFVCMEPSQHWETMAGKSSVRTVVIERSFHQDRTILTKGDPLTSSAPSSCYVDVLWGQLWCVSIESNARLCGDLEGRWYR